MTDTDVLKVDLRDRVAYLTIDRPDQLNALSQEVMADLVMAIEEYGQREDVWLIVLRGAGGKAFSAGVDLKEAARLSANNQRPRVPMRGVYRNTFEVVYECHKPTVAVVDGFALGGGFELAMACDLRLASESSVFGLPESKRGLAANFGAQMISRLVPLGIAYEMLYLGIHIAASEARVWGLVNRVYSAEDFEDGVSEFIGVMLEGAPLSMQRYKSVVGRGRDLPLAAALRLDSSADPYLSADRTEGVRAFVEKRQPVWRGC